MRGKTRTKSLKMIYTFIVAYKVTYGDVDVWVPYRRNYKDILCPTKRGKPVL